MSKLEQLINELCPDGVEYKTLGEICHYSKERIDAEEIDENNYVGVDNLLPEKRGKTNSNYVPTEGRFTQFDNGDVLIGNIRPYLRKIWRATHIGGTNGDVLVVRINENHVGDLASEYLYYVLSSELFFQYDIQNSKGAKMPRGSKDAIMKYNFPLPPLAVQGEIVRILDNFTELTAELTAELIARKKQYEYYRNALLDFGQWGGASQNDYSNFPPSIADLLRKLCPQGVGYKMLDEVIISLNTGLNPRQFFALNTDDAENYYVTIRELQNNKIVFSEKTDRINDDAMQLCNNRSNLEVGDVLFSGTGTIGETAIIEEYPANWNIKEGVYTIKPDNRKILSIFMMYLLKAQSVKTLYLSKVAGGTVKSLPMGEMRKLTIPIPPLAVQEHIVAILDHFHTLTIDITNGLPAEIEARRKQYEYYRDRLLTFKEIA